MGTPFISKRGRQALLRIGLILFAGYILWLAVLFGFQNKLLFPRDLTPKPAPPPDYVERVTIPIKEGIVEGWFCPAPGASPASPAPLVIYFHGNGELISMEDQMAKGYNQLGVSVLLPEYRGYGNSSGTPSQSGIAADMEAFYDMMAARPDVDAKKIIFHGRSLGGGVAAQLASTRKPAGLILESTFASVAAMAARYGAPQFLARNPYRTDKILPNLDIPILIMHGTRDIVIPVSNGRQLARIAGSRATYVEYDCGHNDLPGAQERDYWERIKALLLASISPLKPT